MRRVSAERRLEVAIEALAKALDRSGAPWMIIGGIAVIAHGVRRLTTDIDVAVLGDAIEVRELLTTFRKSKIVPRIDDAQAFASRTLVLLLRHQPTGIDLDVSLAWSGFEHEALRSRIVLTFGRTWVPMASPEDLVVFKLVGGRPKDLEDARALLALHPSIDLKRVRRHVEELARLLDDDSIVAELARVARSAKPHRRAKKTTRSRPTRR